LQTPLRRATLINKTEAFLLQAITSGYSVTEIENSFLLALDRYKTLPPEKAVSSGKPLRFVGSHDPAVTLVSSRLAEKHADFSVKITFVGSLGGLLALARGDADFAGSHLWDLETGIYNRPFIHRIFPGKRIALLRLADRHIGLIFNPGNPKKISGLKDLTKTDVRFINRQEGAGTRVWLDSKLHILKLNSEEIFGFTNTVNSHAEVAGAILENQADTGLGIETAALGYGLEFLPLTTENYDLVIPEEKWDQPSIQHLRKGLKDPNILEAINLLGGYDTSQTGIVDWVE
jgi:putative molybdopterin biosynthesis protein